MKFQINYDLDNIVIDGHNICHTVGTCLLGWIFFIFWQSPFVWLVSYGCWFLWEIGDGLKKWWYEAPYEVRHATFPSWNWVKRETLYSNKFSLQDILIFNLSGYIAGLLSWCVIY